MINCFTVLCNIYNHGFNALYGFIFINTCYFLFTSSVFITIFFALNDKTCFHIAIQAFNK